MNELIIQDNNQYLLSSEALIEMINIDIAEKKLKEAKKNIRARIKEEMETKSIKKIDMPELSITYKEPSDKESFNEDKFQEEYPELYDDYIEMKPTSSSILVKIKNGN